MAHADDASQLDHLDARRLMRDLRELRVTDDGRAARLAVTDALAPGPAGAPPVPVRVYRPVQREGELPVVVSIHGGAFVAGSFDDVRSEDERLADELGCAVVAVEYRLAPEHPFPAAPEDCYAALCWVHDHARELGLDASRLVVHGASAGGALAAAVCLMARDRGGPRIAAQILVIPVVHDRLDTPSQRAMLANPGFSGAGAIGMWAHYLGDIDRTTTSPYAAPGRATDLRGLPPAYVRVHERDPLRDEGIELASRLLAAGVPVELHCFPGMFHGAPALDPSVEVRANAELLAVLARHLCVTPPREARSC